MKRSDTRILTTHVGSLIRPPDLLAFATAKQQGEPGSRGGQGPLEWEVHGYRPSRWAFSINTRMRAMSTGPLRSSCRSRSAATASSVDPSKKV